MSDPKELNDLLDVISKILLRCFVLGYLLLLIWISLVLLAPNLLYEIGKLYDLTPHEVNVGNYCGMAFVKLCVLLFFLFPYVSIRLVMRKRSG